MPPCGLPFSVKDVTCLPAVQVTFTVLDASGVFDPVVTAAIVSAPVLVAVYEKAALPFESVPTSLNWAFAPLTVSILKFRRACSAC